MYNYVNIPEERLFELLREESTLEAYRKSYGELERKITEIRKAMYVVDRTDRARLEEIDKIIHNREAK